MSRKSLVAATLGLLLGSLALAQGSFYRTAEGQWKPLAASSAGQITKFSLSPDKIGGGATLIVLNKPDWMVLDDRTAPQIVKVLVDGQERPADDLDLGQVAAVPQELAFAIRDEHNPLDQLDVRVTLNGRPVPPEQVAVARLTPDSKYLRIAIKPGALPEAKYSLTAAVSDMAPERNIAELTLKFSTAPLLANGSFEQVDREGKPVAWVPGAWSSDATTKYEAGVMEGGVAGKQAFRIRGLEGALNLVVSQMIDPLKPETRYVLSGQYKTDAGAAVSVITTVKGERAEYLTHSLPAAKDWTPFTYEFQLKPHDSVQIVPRTGSKGETWFDDLKLIEK